MPEIKSIKKTAEDFAKEQKEISISEFFEKNKHLLGFDNPTKALLMTVKEACDNSLDACEEAGILPDITVKLKQTGEDKFRVTVQDNGPGIVKEQIPKIFWEAFVRQQIPPTSSESWSARHWHFRSGLVFTVDYRLSDKSLVQDG